MPFFASRRQYRLDSRADVRNGDSAYLIYLSLSEYAIEYLARSTEHPPKAESAKNFSHDIWKFVAISVPLKYLVILASIYKAANLLKSLVEQERLEPVSNRCNAIYRASTLRSFAVGQNWRTIRR
jgi:hypothetical protein